MTEDTTSTILTTTILTTAQAAEILGIGLHGVIKAITRKLLPGAVKLGTGKRGTWAIPLDAVLKYKVERRSPGRPKRKPPAPVGGLNRPKKEEIIDE